MNVTEQINRQMIGMGGGSANPNYLSVNKSLNFAKGSNSIVNAHTERVTAIPYTSNYKDTVGLFGAENVFIKVQLDVQNTLQIDENGVLIDGYEDVVVTSPDPGADIYWTEAVSDFNADLTIVNTFEPAVFTNELNFVPGAVIKIDLENLKTGNKYLDAWFDVRLYQKNREEHAYDTMYVPVGEFFYIGFHARNTKRLPYNVRMTVNGELISKYDLTAEQRRYLVD